MVNLYDMAVSYLKNFKEKFLDKLIEFLEQEIPTSENKMEPLYLEVIFRL